MIPRRFASLIPIVVLAGCASGSTLRGADGNDSGANEPVSLAPEPQPAETTATSTPSAAYAPDTAVAPAPEGQGQGYTPYGGTRPLDIQRIGQWTRTGIAEARRLVIRDANAWDEFWSELGVGDRPAVDFSRDVVVVATAGQQPTGGHEIAIDRVTQTNGELNVEVIERTPGPNCMTTASLTQPVDVVVVPASEARSWRFVERKEIRRCR